MPCCATANPGPRVRPERPSHGSQTGRGERRLKAVSRRRRGRDSARLEPTFDAADPSAITSTLDVKDSRSLDLTPFACHPWLHGPLVICRPPGKKVALAAARRFWDTVLRHTGIQLPRFWLSRNPRNPPLLDHPGYSRLPGKSRRRPHAPKERASAQACSPNGRATRPSSWASRLAAVPSIARLAIPCAIAAIRNRL